MIVNKNDIIEAKLSEFDFTDSIITKIYFEVNLTDLIIEVDYFWTELETGERIEFKFCNCLNFNYDMPKNLYELNNGELNWSQFTIQKIEFENSEFPKLDIYTYNYMKPLVSVQFADLTFSRKE